MTYLSVIIPTLNEEKRLSALLRSLSDQDPGLDIVVVDGGSADATVAIARAHGARVFQTAPSRGGQLRVGAKEARGEVLWFLHADSTVQPGATQALIHSLQSHPNAPGGNFRLLFDGNDAFAAWLNGFYARIRRRGFYYGDSGVFVRKAIYDQIGGMPDRLIMEDYLFNRRLEGVGRTLCVEDPVLLTSSRRFAGRRKWAIIAEWSIVHMLFHIGLPDAWLARLYNTTRTTHRGDSAYCLRARS